MFILQVQNFTVIYKKWKHVGLIIKLNDRKSMMLFNVLLNSILMERVVASI